MDWTPQLYEAFGLRAADRPRPIPFGPLDVASALGLAAGERPNAEALVGRHARYTYREYDLQVNAAAAYLKGLGVRAGDRVAASAENHPEIVIAFFAAMRLGAIWVGINRRLAPAEKRFLLEDSGASLLLADDFVLSELGAGSAVRGVSIEPASVESEWRRGLEAHVGAGPPAVRIDPWAPAAIAYTSGTTGFPKGAVHSQHNMMLVAAAVQHGQDAQELASRRYGTSTPLTILNLMILGPVSAARAQAAHVCMDRTDAVGVAEWIAAERITTTNCAPTTAYDMLTRPDIPADSLKSLRQLTIGGAIIPEALPGLYAARFGHLPRLGYGLTEAPTGVAAVEGEAPSRQGELGRPLVQFEIEILDEDGRVLPADTSGEICFRAASDGPFAGIYTPALGYWRNPEATARLLRGGWVRTGDIGFKDAGGSVHIQDRRSDVITRGGANIYPAEVERVLRMDRRVADCAAVGKPDPRLGQVVAAFIQPAAGVGWDDALQADLQALCQENLARYKHPVVWTALEQLPRNVAGKVLKSQLSQSLADAGPATAAAS